MTLTITAPPTAEPVALADAKAYLRVTSDAEDGALAAIVTASRARLEAELGLAFVATGFQETFDAWPDAGGALTLARGPLIAVSAVSWTAGSRAPATLDPSVYLAPAGARPGALTTLTAWPAPVLAAPLTVTVDYTAGFGPDGGATPATLRQAILMLASATFDARDGGGAAPPSLEPWIAPWRRVRL